MGRAMSSSAAPVRRTPAASRDVKAMARSIARTGPSRALDGGAGAPHHPRVTEALFDELLARRRAARAVAGPDFLDLHAASEAVERLQLTGRAFATVAIRTPRPAPVASVIAQAYPAAAHVPTHVPAQGRQAAEALVALFAAEATNDPVGTLVDCRNALAPDGLFIAAMLSGDTFCELRHAWAIAETELYGGASPRVAPFGGVRDLGGLLQRAGFAMPVADSERLTVRYADPLALMREIKAMGWSNALTRRSRRPATRTLVQEAARQYAARFSDPDGRIRATIEICWLTGWSPGPGQPKPLKPGSAKARLADALGAVERKLP